VELVRLDRDQVVSARIELARVHVEHLALVRGVRLRAVRVHVEGPEEAVGGDVEVVVEDIDLRILVEHVRHRPEVLLVQLVDPLVRKGADRARVPGMDHGVDVGLVHPREPLRVFDHDVDVLPLPAHGARGQDRLRRAVQRPGVPEPGVADVRIVRRRAGVPRSVRPLHGRDGPDEGLVGREIRDGASGRARVGQVDGRQTQERQRGPQTETADRPGRSLRSVHVVPPSGDVRSRGWADRLRHAGAGLRRGTASGCPAYHGCGGARMG